MIANDALSLKRCPATIALIEPVPSGLLDTPLDYLFAEHFRQRCFSNRLRELASTRRVMQAEARSIASFLTDDLAVHHDDEKIDLFPAILRRAKPEDGLEPVIASLASEYDVTQKRMHRIIADLRRQSRRTSITITRQCSARMNAYATRTHRHLSLMNGIILVIARKRLTTSDLAVISREMKLRRGVQA